MKAHLTAEAVKAWLFFAACAGLTIFITLNIWRHLDDRAIYPGWLVQEYIAAKAKAPQSALDFGRIPLAGMYDQSLVMRPALFLYEKFGLAPEKYNRAHIFLQTALLIGGLAFLISTFTKSRRIKGLALLLTLYSPCALKNLGFFFQDSRFVEALNSPVYYLPAYAMAIMALACFFRERFLGMFVFIGLAVWCHVAMGVMLAVFIGAYFLVRPRAALRPAFGAGLLICAGLALPVAAGALGTSTGQADLPMEEWLIQLKMFDSHWFLFNRPLISLKQTLVLLGLTFIFFAVLPRLSLERPLREKLMAGAAGVWALSLIGLIFVEIRPVQQVVFFCPQRSLYLISLLAVPLAACWLLKLVTEPAPWPRRLAAAALFSLVLFFGNYWAYPLHLSLWLMVIPLLTGLLWPRFEPWLALGRPAGPLAEEPAPAGRRDKLLALGLIAALTIGGAALEARNTYRLYKYFFTPWFGADPAQVSAYKEVQLWAEAHSPDQSLFMADPAANNYAWHAYARRPYFGNVYNWGYMPLCYIPNAEYWREGRRRLREFGLDLDRIRPEELEARLSSTYYAQFLPLISGLYYALPPERFEYFRRVYQVDYAIMEKAKVKEARGQLLRRRFPVVFENSYYFVLALGAWGRRPQTP